MGRLEIGHPRVSDKSLALESHCDFYCDDLLLPLHTGVYIYLVECIDTSFSFFSFFSFSFFSW